MAELKLENGQKLTALIEIQAALAPLGVVLKNWPVNPSTRPLLSKSALNDSEKEQVLSAHDEYFQTLQISAGYQSRDLIVLHADVPQLDELLKKFKPCHTHADDEVRYIVDGEGVFGFAKPDGSHVALTVTASEYINVPAHTEHWFYLTELKRIKAVRYFTSTSGWTPVYTATTARV